MLKRLHDLIEQGKQFAFETTGAGHGHIRILERCRDAGYEINGVQTPYEIHDHYDKPAFGKNRLFCDLQKNQPALHTNLLQLLLPPDRLGGRGSF
jgi:hypothetical protein